MSYFSSCNHALFAVPTLQAGTFGQSRSWLQGILPSLILGVVLLFTGLRAHAFAAEAPPLVTKTKAPVSVSQAKASHSAQPPLGRPITIGAKNFSEQAILAEILAILLEEKLHQQVAPVISLAGSHFTFEALRTDQVDLYVDYTGTGLANLKRLTSIPPEVMRDADKAYRWVSEEFRQRFDILWSPPLGFNNTYALAIREDDPRFQGITTVSELAKHSKTLRLGTDHGFFDRPDGYPNLQATYDLKIPSESLVALDSGLMAAALAQGQVDAIVAFSTDGRLSKYKLRLLKDDRHCFPPYEASVLYKPQTVSHIPGLAQLLVNLKNSIDEPTMMQMNYQVDVLKYPPREVAQIFVDTYGDALMAGQPVSSVTLKRTAETKGTGLFAEQQEEISFWQYVWVKRDYVWRLTLEHLSLTAIALSLALGVGLPLAILLTRFPKLETPVFSVINVFQTIPSLALLGLLIPVLGIGIKPALVALFLYALLPLVQNTFIGLKEVDPSLKEAVKGLGLTENQILTKVEIPLAMPTIMAGVRTSMVMLLGTATLAALIGAGGLGDPIFRGISSVNPNNILLGALPVSVLAIVLDRLFYTLQMILTPKGLSVSASSEEEEVTLDSTPHVA